MLHSRARRTLKALATAVAGNAELAFSSPAFRLLKRHLLSEGRGLATGMGAHGTHLNMLCAIDLTAQRAPAADRVEVTGVMQKQRQNLLDVGILVGVGTGYRRFQKDDLLYKRLVEAGVPGSNLDAVGLLYTIYNFDIIIGMIKLLWILADCSFGRERNNCGIIGDFNRLSPEDYRAGVRLAGAEIRREKRTVDHQLLDYFEGMRRDPSLRLSFGMVVDLAHVTAKPGFEGEVFVIKCEDLSWWDLKPLYAQVRTLLVRLGDLDLLSPKAASQAICNVVERWASSGNALIKNLPIAFVPFGQEAVACKHVLSELRVTRAITKLGVLQPPTDKLILAPVVLEIAAKAAMQRATDRKQWAHDRLRRAQLNVARRAEGDHVPVLPVLQHGQRAVWALPPLTSCASSGRAWRLWAARHSQGEASPLGPQPLPRVLELAASKAAHLPAF